MRAGGDPVGPACDGMKPTGGRGHVAKAGLRRLGPGLALLASGKVYDVRLDLLHIEVIQLPVTHGLGGKVLSDNIRLPLGDDAPYQLPGLGLGHVQPQAVLAGVEISRKGAGIQAGVSRLHRRRPSKAVGASDRLHVDHLGPVVRQVLDGYRAHAPPAEIQDFEVVKGHCRCHRYPPRIQDITIAKPRPFVH